MSGFGILRRVLLGMVINTLAVLPIVAAEFPVHGPLDTIQIRMEISAFGGGAPQVELSGEGKGTYRFTLDRVAGAPRDTTIAFSFAPQEFLGLVNEVHASQFMELPSRIFGSRTFVVNGDGTYSAKKSVWVDVGSTRITLRIGDYVKTVEYSNGVAEAPLWLVNLGNRIHLFAEYRTLLAGGRIMDAGAGE